MNEIQVQRLALAEVDPDLGAALYGRLYVLCFPPAHVSPSSQEPCLVPTHYFVIRDHDGAPIGSLALHDRTIHSALLGDLRTGGMAGVCVLPDHRLMGYARALIEEAHRFLRAQEVPFALLFGRREYYKSSGYRNVTNIVRSYDRKKKDVVEQQYPDLMVAALGTTPWPEGLINLNGPDF